MLKIGRKVEYALMALKYMVEEKDTGEVTSAREVCERFQVPFDTTSKVMQIMNQHGILSSTQGIKGGYIIDRPLSAISYLELVSMIERKSNGSVCESTKGQCELYDLCNIVGPLERLNKALNSYLEELTIEKLFTMSFPPKEESLQEAANER